MSCNILCKLELGTMDKSYIIVALMIAVILLAIYFPRNTRVDITEAKHYVEEDLRNRYPTADIIGVLNASEINGAGGTYYNIRGRVTMNLDSQCPDRRHIYYNYPAQNFVPQPDEYITRGCRICINITNCLLAFEEEAIIASHTLPGTGAVQQFLNDSSDAKPIAAHDNQTGTWAVTWESKRFARQVSVLISDNAYVIE